MRRIHINNLKPGMILGKTIYGENYGILLKEGIELTKEHIVSLKKRGYVCIYINDEDTADIETRDISQKIRAMATRDIIRTYKKVEASLKDIRKGAYESIIKRINTPKIKITFQECAELNQLIFNLRLFLDEIMNRDVLIGLNSIKSHDNYTYEHSVDTAIVSMIVAKRMCLDKKRLKQIAIGEFLHDIGKIFVDEKILNKPDKLTDEEYKQVKQHPVFGYELLKDIEDIGYVSAHIAYQHHERQDESGYPRGLKGTNTIDKDGAGGIIFSEEEKLILPAEIAAISDFYDACVSDRPYRCAIPHDIVYELLKAGAETRFNKELIDYFLEVIPKYPVAAEIKVKNGEFRNFTGFVMSLNRHHLNRPKIKILYDGNKNKIKPIIIDLSGEGLDIDVQCVF